MPVRLDVHQAPKGQGKRGHSGRRGLEDDRASPVPGRRRGGGLDVDVLRRTRCELHDGRRDLPERRVALRRDTPGHDAVGAVRRRDVAEDDTGPGSRGRSNDVDVAVVADPLGQRVRREPAVRVDEDEAHPGVVPVRRVRRVGNGRVEPVLPGRDVERERPVVVRQALIVGELRAGGVVQRHGAGLDVAVAAEGATGQLHTLCGDAGVGDRELEGLVRPGKGDRREGVGRLQQRRPRRRRRAVRGLDGLGQLTAL